MVAESGARLLDEDAQEALRTLLLPRAAVVTPNVPEARALVAAGPAGGCGGTGFSRARPRPRDRRGHRRPPRPGGRCLLRRRQLVEIPGERYVDGAAHGSGCTHSSALAAHLALGFEPLEAARAAKRIASDAVTRRTAQRRGRPRPGGRLWRRGPRETRGARGTRGALDLHARVFEPGAHVVRRVAVVLSAGREVEQVVGLRPVRSCAKQTARPGLRDIIAWWR